MVWKKRVVQTIEEWNASRAAKLPADVDLVVGVAEKALAMGHAAEAERLVATATNDFAEWVRRATTEEEWDDIERIRARLARVLPRIEEATGRRWTACLDFARQARIEFHERLKRN